MFPTFLKGFTLESFLNGEMLYCRILHRACKCCLKKKKKGDTNQTQKMYRLLEKNESVKHVVLNQLEDCFRGGTFAGAFRKLEP